MRVLDLLGCFDYLASRPDVDASDIGVVGKGAAGVTALYAAALEPRIARTAVEEAPMSYLDLARARFYQDALDIVVPGLLKDFDLPDIAASLAPRTLWLVNPVTASGVSAPVPTAAVQYAAVAGAYASLNAGARFRIVEQVGQWNATKLLGEWLDGSASPR
jgi:hypothetical protein